MEPPHWVFESTHRLYDSKGDLIPPLETSAPLLYHHNEELDDDNREEHQDVVALDSGESADSVDPSIARTTYGSEPTGTHHTAADRDGDIPPGTKVAGFASPSSAHSLDTLHSVYMAHDVINSLQYNDELLRGQDLPERYHKGSVKAKVTWFGALCLAGVGMFVEALVIITTGQIKSVWHAAYPECWDFEKDQHCPNNIQCCGLFVNTPYSGTGDNVTCAATLKPPGFCQSDGTYPEDHLCSSRVTSSVSYSEFAGIMCGMLTFGLVCDKIGRKNAGTITSILMLGGIAGMTLLDSSNVTTLFTLFSIFFAIFGFGVGGEYPLTASGAAEYHAVNTEDALLDNVDQHQRRVLLEAAMTVRRGETIALVFAMQGFGAVLGSVLLLILIYVSNQTRIDCDNPSSNSTGNNPDALNAIWRGFYLIGLLFVASLLLYRWLVLEEGTDHAKMLKRQKRREARLGPASTYRWKVLRFYALRLLGTGGNWFVWDFAFYGLKLFSGPIFAAINPQGDLVVQNGWLLFNNVCALVGYYCAALLIDIPWIGRKKLQMVSFTICAFLFLLTGAVFDTAKPQTLMFLFFASSFFGQVGANVTTYVMAAETYPTELRATCHGISAFLGKSGALIATIIFAKMETAQIFYTCGATSIIGLIITFLFSVDLTHVPLAEHDAQLELFLEGRLDIYRGRLNAQSHLSNFEIWTGMHGEYDENWASKLKSQEKSAKSLSQSHLSLHSASKPQLHQKIETMVRDISPDRNSEPTERRNGSPNGSPVGSRHKRVRAHSSKSCAPIVFSSMPEGVEP